MSGYVASLAAGIVAAMLVQAACMIQVIQAVRGSQLQIFFPKRAALHRSGPKNPGRISVRQTCNLSAFESEPHSCCGARIRSACGGSPAIWGKAEIVIVWVGIAAVTVAIEITTAAPSESMTADMVATYMDATTDGCGMVAKA
jgi:hypothetical protein